MAPRIANLDEWASHLRTQLHREPFQTGDPALVALEQELATYPGAGSVAIDHDPAGSLFVPQRLRGEDGT